MPAYVLASASAVSALPCSSHRGSTMCFRIGRRRCVRSRVARSLGCRVGIHGVLRRRRRHVVRSLVGSLVVILCRDQFRRLIGRLLRSLSRSLRSLLRSQQLPIVDDALVSVRDQAGIHHGIGLGRLGLALLRHGDCLLHLRGLRRGRHRRRVARSLRRFRRRLSLALLDLGDRVSRLIRTLDSFDGRDRRCRRSGRGLRGSRRTARRVLRRLQGHRFVVGPPSWRRPPCRHTSRHPPGAVSALVCSAFAMSRCASASADVVAAAAASLASLAFM